MERRASRILEQLQSDMPYFQHWVLGGVAHSSMDFPDIYGKNVMVVFAPDSAIVVRHHSIDRFISSQEYWDDQFTFRSEAYHLNTPIFHITEYGGFQYTDLFLSMFPFHITNHIIACYQQYESIVN